VLNLLVALLLMERLAQVRHLMEHPLQFQLPLPLQLLMECLVLGRHLMEHLNILLLLLEGQCIVFSII
jgi:hypothetical protein